MDKGIRVFVGLDVHKDTIALALAQVGAEQACYVGTVGHDVPKLLKLLSRYGEPRTVRVVYEAGPTGYGLYRQLRAKGYEAQVVAPSLIPKRAGVRIKTDRRDCVELARLSRSGELTPVWVPELADEAMRDLVRAREDAVQSRHAARMQLKAFLLRHDVRYSGKSSWTQAHQRWLAGLSFAHPVQQLAFEEYRQAVGRADEQVNRLSHALCEAVAGWRFEAVVRALMSLRGLDVTAAATLVAEIGDIGRFESARALMGYLGLVPSEHSSGSRLRKGAITKTGNAHARRVLTEAAWNYRFPARVARALHVRQQEQTQPIRDISWKAQQRLCGRFKALSARGVHQNKVCVAIARELSGFVWAIAREAARPARAG
jgi:transposase